jgi:hypothetical protein
MVHGMCLGFDDCYDDGLYRFGLQQDIGVPFPHRMWKFTTVLVLR